MIARLQNRQQAGRLLADLLKDFPHREQALVLALPRGGVPVAAPIARALGAPLDVLIVRKLGLPGHSELAMGALAGNGVCVFNHEVLEHYRVSQGDIDAVMAREQSELARREALYRAGRPPLQLQGRWLILVDDGLATGATMRAAIALAKSQQPAGLVVAVPVASRDTVDDIGRSVDQVVCPLLPDSLMAIGMWYEQFPQTSDAEVQALLAAAANKST